MLLIENHSTSCIKVKEDVLKAESSTFSYHTIDYKLRKLQEHLNKIQSQLIKSKLIIYFSINRRSNKGRSLFLFIR